jgi:pyruvate ferredoxin oxidoreductase delta subunit
MINKKTNINNRKMFVDELPVGDILDSGTAVDFKTGSWRSETPIFDKKKCINCLICWISCPDSSIKIFFDEKNAINTSIDGIDYDHCKGCGICASECPTKAITMIEEKKVVFK